MAIVRSGGKIVSKDGKLGTGQACCCKKCEGPCDEENPCPEGCVCVDGQCVPPTSGACCGWICDYLGDILWPEDWYDPESPNYQNYLSIPPPEGWLGGFDGGWLKTINGVENCTDPDVYAAIVAELEAELNAYVVPLGGVVNQILLYPDSSGQGCFPAAEQECSGTFAGTWYESQEECLPNCPNPLP